MKDQEFGDGEDGIGGSGRGNGEEEMGIVADRGSIGVMKGRGLRSEEEGVVLE